MKATRNTAAPENLRELEQRVHYELDLLNYPPSSWTRRTDIECGGELFDVVIIGGGHVGVATLFSLKRHGVLNAVALDRSAAGMEGPWTSYAKMAGLRTAKNAVGPALGVPSLTPQAWYRAVYGDASWTQLQGIPTSDWPKYLLWLRRVLDLPVLNRANVASIKHDGEFFELTYDYAGALHHAKSRKVVLATGRDGLGGYLMPSVVAGLGDAYARHSSQLTEYEFLRNRRVAILGAGASAFDSAAACLDAGAAEVHILVRRSELPRHSKLASVLFPGCIHGFRNLSVGERIKVLAETIESASPPPTRSVNRIASDSRLTVHFNIQPDTIRHTTSALQLIAGKAELSVDFLIAATGFKVDVKNCELLQSWKSSIALWEDILPEHSGQLSSLSHFPYITPSFSFRERTVGAAPELSDIHTIGWWISPFHGVVAGDIPWLDDLVPELGRCIAADLFMKDRQHYVEKICTNESPNSSGYVWRGAKTVQH